MDRKTLINKYENMILDTAADYFELDLEDISKFEAYEGCANLVYTCMRQNLPVILRVSYRSDRTFNQIMGEIDFIEYLAENRVRVSTPIASKQEKYVEAIIVEDKPLYFVCFSKGRGTRVPDNNYRYRDDAPIEEYFQNWGKILGKMHSLSKNYKVSDPKITRPDWFDLHAQELNIDAKVLEEFPIIREKIDDLLQEIALLPRNVESYGLIHGDFNDGNFTVDYSNGDITVFDFDDCCYFWFVSELASAWEGGIGRVMFRGVEERRDFMNRYMDFVLSSYLQQNSLSDKWLKRIPLFIKLIQIQEFLYFSKYLHVEDHEMKSHLRYLIACIERDLPYMGFFDSIFNPEHPFSLGVS